MASNRPNLTLDEQSFEGLLSAAFTIQEHNDRVKQVHPAETEPEPSNICPHCGTRRFSVGSRCASCGLDELRPGERLQRNWASMWLMSQEQRLWPERSPEIHEGLGNEVPPLEVERRPRAQAAGDFASAGTLALPAAKEGARKSIAQERTPTIQHRAADKSMHGKSVPEPSVLGKSLLEESALRESMSGKLPVKATAEHLWITKATADFPPEPLMSEDLTQEDSDVTAERFQLSATDDSYPAEFAIGIDDAAPDSLTQRFAGWRVKLHFQRADLYLGVAVFVAAIALLWPAAGAPQRAALGPWERALVALGIAEAPAAPVVHLHGDPGIAVWVDPHSALYYCPGEEQYGKTTDGRFSSQREAMMDRFEPASRSACE